MTVLLDEETSIIALQHITIEVYEADIAIYLTDNVATAMTELGKTNPTVDENTIAYVYGVPGANVLLINKNLVSLRDIVHEADHITNQLCAKVGIKKPAGDDEAHAYLLDCIFAKILKFLHNEIGMELYQRHR